MRWQLGWTSRPSFEEGLNFMGPRVSTAPWAWLLLLVGLLLAAWQAPRALALDEAVVAQQQTLKRLQRAAHQQSLAEQARSRSQMGSHGEAVRSDEQWRRAAQLAQSLSYPWQAVLDQVDAVAKSEHARLLAFSVDLASISGAGTVWPDVRISAALQDDEAALRWALSHGAAAQLLNRERLAEPRVTEDGTYVWRAEAVWNGVSP